MESSNEKKANYLTSVLKNTIASETKNSTNSDSYSENDSFDYDENNTKQKNTICFVNKPAKSTGIDISLLHEKSHPGK